MDLESGTATLPATDDPGAPAGVRRLRGFRAPSPAESRAAAHANPAADPGSDGAEPPGSPPPRAPGRNRTGWRWAAAAGGVLVLAIVIIAVLAFRLGASSSPTAAPKAAGTPTPTTTATSLPVTDVYRQVVPSVVLITTSKGSLGSGVIATDSGTILTANHVISDGGAVSILFSDGTKAAATVASSNKTTDIAVLTPKALPEVVVAATLGGSIAVGANVVAIGNPLGLRDSTSAGVVSGLNRPAKTDAGALSGLIQFDAAVNPGSSGGPLLNSQGSVVGIVVSIADPGGDDAFAGIGFAVPIGTALGGGGSGTGPGGGPQL